MTTIPALWGMDRNGKFVEGNPPSRFAQLLSCMRNSSSQGLSVKALLQTELGQVARQVRAEIDLGYPDLSSREKTKRLLFLFQCDLLPGLSGQVLSSKGNRDNLTSARPVAPWQKAAGYLTVLLVDAAMLFYVFLFAMQQTKVRQVSAMHDLCICMYDGR